MNIRSKIKGAAFAAPFLGLLLWLWSGLVMAAAVDVNPVRLDLYQAGVSAELHIRNEDTMPVSMDIVAMFWSQNDLGENQLAETDQILAVPPIFTIKPGGQQIVRVAFLGNPDPEAEQTFRLLITELAPVAGSQDTAVTMRLQVSLPVFVTLPGLEAEPSIELLSAEKTEHGTHVSLLNAGNAHVKLKSVEVTGSAGTLPGENKTPVGQARYLLPGARVEFLVPGDPGVLQRVNITSERGRGWEHAVANPE
jgi:fimbrial chaperone protein